MPEDSPATGAPVVPVAMPPAGTDPAPAAEDDQETMSLAEARKLRREANALRKQIDERQAELDRAREAAASEGERALIAARKEAKEAADREWQTRLDDMNARRQRALIVAEIKGLAASEFIDLDDVVMALAANEDITVDEHDRVRGVRKALDALKEAKPHWVKQAPAERPPAYGSPRNGQGGPSNGRSPAEEEALRREQARRTRSYF